MARIAIGAAVILIASCNEVLGHHDVMLRDGDADASDPCASFTPAALSNLVVWLDAATVVADGGAVSIWPDQSSHGHDALVVTDVGTPAPPPTIHAGALNQHDAIRFSTPSQIGGPAAYANMRIADSADLQWGVGGYLVAIVVSYTNPGGHDEWGSYASVWSKVESVDPQWGVALTGNVPVHLFPDGGTEIDLTTFGAWQTVPPYGPQAGVVSAPDMNTGKFHVVVMQRNASATELALRVDGVRTSVAITPHEIDAVGIDVSIGGRPVPNAVIEPLAGEIAEIVAVRGEVDDVNEACLESYLRTKFAL